MKLVVEQSEGERDGNFGKYGDLDLCKRLQRCAGIVVGQGSEQSILPLPAETRQMCSQNTDSLRNQ